jgi:hypothetical protein
MTSMSASFKVLALPPVERILIPKEFRAAPSSTKPDLSDTLINAVYIFAALV